ncbi:hypothetical protein FT663_03021 [Candidozyma haemuli var. vulneris]|nr:hypothetical protein FT662_02182 [[Candida] haemuloni var. vulneris]KAF3990755.1 hypothetical protein FT663_03021 [[Candida] haemuloni var. vulneris]
MAPAAPALSRSSRGVKKRSRNFDGCWTCRLRKIKCDCTRPVCLRCKRAKLECKGYSIVLAWAAPLVVDQENQLVSVKEGKGSALEKERLSSRRNVDLVYFPSSMQYETYAKLNAVVSQLDDVSKKTADGSDFFVGPFGAFVVPGKAASTIPTPKVSPTKKAQPEETLPEVQPMDIEEAAKSADSLELSSSESIDELIKNTENERIDSDRLEPETSIFSKTDNTYVHYALLDSAKLTTLAIKGTKYEFSEQSMFHILYPNFFPNIDPDDWRPSVNVMLRYFRQSVTAPGGVEITPLLTTTTQQLDASSMAFTRVVYERNQWDTYVLPLIKQIFFELVCEEFPSSNNWRTHYIRKESTTISRTLLLKNLRLGIMFMCLATSAFRKSSEYEKKNVNNDVKTYYMDDELKAAIEMRKLGINILNYHLDEYDNNSSYPEIDNYETCLLLALLLQINLDDLFGVYENYELIFAIGDFLVKSRLRKVERKLTTLDKYLRSVFEILQIFYNSTQAVTIFNYEIPDKDRQQRYRDLDENYDLSKNLSDVESYDSTSEESDNLEGNERPKNISVAAGTTDDKNPLSFTVHFNEKSNRQRKASHTELPSLPLRRSTMHSSSSPICPELGDRSVYVSYGLPKSLLQLLHEVVQLTNHKRVFQTQGFFPRNYPRVCADTEDKILNWNVESYWKLYDNEYDPITNTATKTFYSSFHEGLYYNVMGVYHALKVYYKRLIPGSSLTTTQSHIHACMDSMEKLIKLSEELQKRKEPFFFSPSFWPILVCGCDIDIHTNSKLQQRCRSIWSHRTFRKHNYWRSKQILFEVWKRRSEGEDIGFMDLVRDWTVVLCLG